MASRTNWTVETKSLGGSWTNDGTIYAPNQVMVLGRTSTQATIKLADGDNAYITPSTKYTLANMTFAWMLDDGTLKLKIEGYVENNTNIRITDDNSKTYIGRFISIQANRAVGVDENEYDINAIFQQMPEIA